MIRRPRIALAAVALLAPLALAPSTASAVDQDLVVSVPGGAASTVVEVSSASCVDDEAAETFRYLIVRLISGTAPAELLAGYGAGFEGDVARVIVPDWVDPDEPAVIEATCVTISYDEDGGSLGVAFEEFAFDPVPFDVEPQIGSGPGLQQRTFSRTSLLAGQAFNLEASGCFLVGAAYAGVDVLDTDDLSGRNLDGGIAFAEADLLGDTFGVDVAMSNGSFGVGFSQIDDGPEVIDFIEEEPTNIPPGSYVTLSYCGNDDGTILLFEPELIEVTGDAPFGDVDLTVPEGTPDVTFAGGSCTAGPVDAFLAAESIEGIFDDWDLDFEVDGTPTDDLRASLRSGPAGPVAARSLLGEGSSLRSRSISGGSLSDRALSDAGMAELTIDPDGDGAWSYQDAVDFDRGFVEGYAVCGDPLADGFFYDPQVAGVQIDRAPVAPPAPPAPPAPVAPPADAVAGTPRYTG